MRSSNSREEEDAMFGIENCAQRRRRDENRGVGFLPSFRLTVRDGRTLGGDRSVGGQSCRFVMK